MKKIILACALLFAASAAVEATTPTSVKLISKSSSSYEIVYSAAERTTVKITISDKSGKRLTSRTIRSVGSFRMPLVLQDLHPGDYQVTIDNGTEILKKEFSVVAARPMYSHVTSLGDGKYLVSVSNASGSQAINISVYDAQSNLVQNLNETVDGQKAVVIKTQDVYGIPFIEVTDASGLTEVIHN